MVTATLATRVAFPYLTNPDLASKYLWQAITLAFIAIYHLQIELDSIENNYKYTNLKSWDELKNIAPQRTDFHDIKLVYSRYKKAKTHGFDLYRYAIQSRHKA